MIRIGGAKRLVLVLALLCSNVLLASTMPATAQTVDPRTPNARAFHVSAAGLVDGVELVYVERPDTAYQLVQARLVDEAGAAGNTVASFTVIDCNGVPVSENVYLAWPWPSLADGKLLPGNQNSQHMIYSTFSPPDIGPLAVYVGDAQGRINSDLIGGLGLPFKRHVSFYLAFKRRCQTAATATPTPQASATPKPSVTPGPVTGDLSETNGLLRQILDVLRALAGHLGVAGYAPGY